MDDKNRKQIDLRPVEDYWATGAPKEPGQPMFTPGGKLRLVLLVGALLIGIAWHQGVASILSPIIDPVIDGWMSRVRPRE